MDGNNLIEILNTVAPLTNSSISAVVGAVLTTLFLRKNTKVEEFEKIKAYKFSEVINNLLDSGKMSYLEYYKCNNFLDIAKIADKRLNEYEIINNSLECPQYDFDWFLRFYDYASNISQYDMQKIWADVLARETVSPKTTSISLLHSLSMMKKEHADFFCYISRFSLQDIKDESSHLLLFVSSSRDAYENSGITPARLKELERLGLLECDFSSEYVFKNKKMFKTGNKIITVYGNPENENKIKAGNCNFTEDGQILFSIIDDDFKKYRSDILDFIITKFQRRNCRVTINGREVL